jgi:hypothetical protein
LPVELKKKQGWQKSVENLCRHVAPFYDEHFVDECDARSCAVSVLSFYPEKARVGDKSLWSEKESQSCCIGLENCVGSLVTRSFVKEGKSVGGDARPVVLVL